MTALADPRPKRIVVASDLHLGRGWDPVTETCVSSENFIADVPFAEWLDHYGADAADTLLILNGDVFDVLRVTDIPATDDDFERWAECLAALDAPRSVSSLRDSVTRTEHTYGLKTHDYKTVWKMILIAEGHSHFFDAMAGWVARGGRLQFTTGNHDVELYWPLVQRFIRYELAARGAGEGAESRVAFADSHLVIDNLYVEHGHQYEPMTRVEGGPTLPGPDSDEINLPLGSFVNRYFINRIEALDPFIDNVKPVTESLLRLARQRPLKILGTYFGAWRFLRKALAKRKLNKAVLSIAVGLALPVLLPLLLLLIPGVRDAVLGWVPLGPGLRIVVAAAIGIVVSGAFPYILGVISEIARRRPKPDLYTEAARAAANSWLRESGRDRGYVCMGHTHVSAVKRIDPDGRRLYINTGTWIALWPRDRPDLLGRTVLTYAVFESSADGYRAHVLEWDRHAEKPRAATILVPAVA